MRKITFIFAFLAMSLSSCKTEPSAKTKDTYQPTVVHFSQIGGLTYVKGKINGKEAYFLIDTGASYNIVDESQKTEYGCDCIETEGITQGIGGSVQNKIALNSDIQIGDIVFSELVGCQDITNLRKMIQNNTGIKLAGIIGARTFSNYRVIIDYRTKTITLFP